MKKIARSRRQHQELIFNYFPAGKLIFSGVAEGLNNKAKSWVDSGPAQACTTSSSRASMRR
jgi:hypothetical protein